MALQSVFRRSFAGGEIAPTLAARADLPKYQTALRACRNFLVQRYGGVANRPGTRYVASTKAPSGAVQFLRYVSETAGQSVLIEGGVGYFRFYQNGGRVNVAGVAAWNGATAYVAGDLVVQGGINYYCILAHTNQVPPNATYWYALTGTIYEVPHSFPAGFRWAQSGSIITLTHPSLAPAELIFAALTRWTVETLTTKPAIDAPTNLTGTPSTDFTRPEYRYVVTAADAETYEESEPSNIWTVYRDLGPRKGEPFIVIFDGFQASVKAQAAEYYVYCDPFRNGVFGLLTAAAWDGTGAFHFNDIGFPPDFSQTPPLVVRKFASSGNYPAMAATFQQRRWFANTTSDPEGVWGSRVGFPRNFGIGSPLQDDDAITFRVVGGQRHPVQHLLALTNLVLLTDVGEWLITGDGNGPVMPTSLQADQIGYWGAASVVPVIVGTIVLYVQTRGRILRDLVFDTQTSGLAASRDLTLYAGHLFLGKTLTKIDYAQSPHSIIWAVQSDGALLGLTYIPDEDVWGWHRHDTGASGLFRDVCVVPETNEDAVYVLVERTINGSAVRYIERFASRELTTITDAFFMDAGLTYTGAPANNVTGLTHLIGQVCAVLGDGAVIYDGDPAGATVANFTVNGSGTFPANFPASYSTIHVGIPIRFAEFETLDLDVAGSSVRDKKKRVQSVTLLVEKSAQAFQAGPDRSHLRAFQPPSWEASSALVDDAFEQPIAAEWTKHGRFVVRQTQPLPLTVLGVLPQMDLGG
jgi:hypothetical protein